MPAGCPRTWSRPVPITWRWPDLFADLRHTIIDQQFGLYQRFGLTTLRFPYGLEIFRQLSRCLLKLNSKILKPKGGGEGVQTEGRFVGLAEFWQAKRTSDQTAVLITDSRDEILSLLGGDKKVEIEWSCLVTLRANGGRKRVPEYVISRRTILLRLAEVAQRATNC
ncbi:hypothetical protein FA13DRAFT_1232615 [Coprinellus micaceus]|uniref:Uncharacterized protein n=1 Tax=Coprinellus micaceus TaxID=71717 RepID=A0A4Y7TPS2_COPMI|nr:hypothetical protein FA13DRAFT_1232615 [Coprinellus micaceus]